MNSITQLAISHQPVRIPSSFKNQHRHLSASQHYVFMQQLACQVLVAMAIYYQGMKGIISTERGVEPKTTFTSCTSGQMHAVILKHPSCHAPDYLVTASTQHQITGFTLYLHCTVSVSTLLRLYLHCTVSVSVMLLV